MCWHTMCQALIKLLKTNFQFLLSSVSSVAQLCPTLCDPINCGTPGLPVHHQLLESTKTHVHWVGDAIQASHPLPSLPLFPSVFPSIRVFSSESDLPIRWPKYWRFSFSISPSNEHSKLISFRMDWLDLLAVEGTLKSLLHHHSSKASLFGAQLSLWSSSPIHTWPLEKRGSPVWQLILCVTLTGSEDQLIGLTPIEVLPWR